MIEWFVGKSFIEIAFVFICASVLVVNISCKVVYLVLGLYIKRQKI